MSVVTQEGRCQLKAYRYVDKHTLVTQSEAGAGAAGLTHKLRSWC